MRAALLLVPLLAPALAGAEQTVYRCGQTYQQAPGGQGKAVDVDDSRSESQRRAAQAVAREEARHGASLQRDREQREKSLRPAPAVGIGVPAAAASAPAKPKRHDSRKNKKHAKSDDFVAVEPGKRAAKR